MMHGISGGGGGSSRDRYKAQHKRRSAANSGTSSGRRAFESGSFAEKLLQKYDSEPYNYASASSHNQSNRRGRSQYDAGESKIHGRGEVPEELWPWWRKRSRLLLVLGGAMMVFIIAPRRRKMRVRFPDMLPVGARLRRQTTVEQNHIVQRPYVREKDRPRAQRLPSGQIEQKQRAHTTNARKAHRKSAFETLHLRLPGDPEDVDEPSYGHETNGEDVAAAHVLEAVVDEESPDQMQNYVSPEHSPNDPNAPPIYGMSFCKDTHEKFSKSDVPTFWHVPKSGGSTIKDVAGACHRLVTASNMGVTEGHENDSELQIVHPGGSAFVNVDTITIPGIEHAKEIGFPTSGLAKMIVTTFVREANDLGSSSHMLRFFTVFRHPIERAISMFYYIQVADWEVTYHPELQNWTIEEYALSERAEENWMTRQLVDDQQGELTDDDLLLAKEVLKRKFFVGLTDRMEESMDRFERFFRWTYKVNPTNQEACREHLLTGGGGSNRNVDAGKKKHPKEGTKGWKLLEEKNRYDLQLYEYARELFDEQENLLDVSHPKGYRRIKETCCKCSPATYPDREDFECPK